uniref:Uncharacterized protein n=1 Tax=Anopheles maculatus TaxID=74869 RepID=A0A182SSX1_9DIPT
SNHRFLSDHEYLDESTSRSIRTPTVAFEPTVSEPVERTSERFNVTYVENLELQDLFNKDNAPPEHIADEEEQESQILYEYFETKIELEEPQIQETIIDADYIGQESTAGSEAPDSIHSIMRSLTSTQNVPNEMTESVNRALLDTDHSYTSLNVITPQPSDEEEESDSFRKLVKLSKKLACERDVTTTAGKRTFAKINEVVSTIHNNRGSPVPAEQGPCRTPMKENNGDSPDRLSVLLSTNCSERLEDDGGALPSSGSSNEPMQEDFGSDTECCGAKGDGATEPDRPVIDLDKLLSLGNNFSQHCDRWFEKQETVQSVDAELKASQLVQLMQKITRQCERIPMVRQGGSAATNVNKRKVEIGVQTEESKHSTSMQRTLNERSKQKLLGSLRNSSTSSGSSSSDPSDSDSGSPMSKSLDSDPDGDGGDKMMQEFVKRNKRMRKRAKEKHQKVVVEEKRDGAAATGSSKPRREQIYSDSSQEEKHGDENLELDGVMSDIDNIITDCPDVVMGLQDYFAKAEEEKGDGEEKEKEEAGSEKSSCLLEVQQPPRSKKEPENAPKSVKDMTESEREDYYEDMQIERLCNISNLVSTRNA